MNANGYNVYKNNTVNYASKEQLLLMLVEGAVKFCKIARQAIVDQDIKKANDSLIRTQEIFSELMVSLDTTQGEWAVQLYNIYAFIKQRLFEANMKKSLEIVEEVLPLVEDINETWKEAYKRAKK
ncbi:flagellar export chaperone FliS [Clostridium chromiireducens]|uniref:Flagellar export chaperone FliS n=1 Tax=Clostridium chromiireducens TaxID=225345 RepID=A0A399ISZ4_9CLOT|nr:flagellar export chaperone FliS [Clostridium chromiireducens]RII36198.1 flagellar export chaperone FliS [Clostridium chromiireducens]